MKSKPNTKTSKKPTIKAKPKPKSKTSNAKVSLSPTTDKEWQIQSDARTLKEAMAIKGDPNRMKAAQQYCNKEMESLKQITKMK